MVKILQMLVVDLACQREWCWAAVASAIAAFYPPNPTISQECIADRQLPRNQCLTMGSSDRCNIPQPLESPLEIVCHLDDVLNSFAAPSLVISKTNCNQPLCVRIGWKGKGGHFVVIKGYDDTPP